MVRGIKNIPEQPPPFRTAGQEARFRMLQDNPSRLKRAIDLLTEYRLAHSDVNDPSATASLDEAIVLLQEAVLLSERSDRRRAIVDAVLKLIELLGSGETLFELFKQLVG